MSTRVLMCVLFFAIIVQSRVIKIDEIPIKNEMIMKIAIQLDDKGVPVAKIKFIEKEKGENRKVEKVLPKAAVGVIPDFSDRSGFINGLCPFGRVRRGPACVIAA